ncbi:MAG: hypothetical protein A2Z20_12430 [Bdellovibrionales bacterium RBG_16_40_8]|nr:MAG: hypothetical protein A2Z20_12430 [Bdellovibrionales bacterium RBG_16_40_8]
MERTTTARIDMQKLQLLNDRITMCLDAINQLRATAHNVGFGYAPNTQIGMGYAPAHQFGGPVQNFGFPVQQFGYGVPQYGYSMPQYGYGMGIGFGGGYPVTPWAAPINEIERARGCYSNCAPYAQAPINTAPQAW